MSDVEKFQEKQVQYKSKLFHSTDTTQEGHQTFGGAAIFCRLRGLRFLFLRKNNDEFSGVKSTINVARQPLHLKSLSRHFKHLLKAPSFSFARKTTVSEQMENIM